MGGVKEVPVSMELILTKCVEGTCMEVTTNDTLTSSRQYVPAASPFAQDWNIREL